MGWASGFQAGSAMAHSMIDAYNQGNAWEAGNEISKLSPQAQTVQGKGLQITAPDGTVSTAVLDPAAGGDIGAITKQYADAGYKVAPVGAPQYISRSGSLDTGAASDSQSAAMHDTSGFNVDHLNQMAAIYAKYGEPDKAAALTTQAQQAQRQGMMDDRQNTEWDTKQKLQADIQAASAITDPVQRNAAIQKAMLRAGDAVGAMQFHNADSQSQAADIELEKKKQIRDAIATTQNVSKLLVSKDKNEQAKGYQSLVDMYNQHPEFNDGITASLTQDTSGHFIMVKADTQGRPVGKPEIMTNQTAMDYLHQGQSHLLSLLDPEYGQRQQQIDQSGQQIKQTGEYQQGSLANDRTRLGLEGQRVAIARQAAAAAERSGKMGSVISTDQGMFVPIMGKDGTFTLQPLTAGGKALNKSAAPIDPATGFKITQQVEADIASDKSLRGASKDRIDAARQRLTANYRAMVIGATPPGSGFDPRAGLDAVKPAAAAAPTVAADSESQYTDKPAPTNIFQDITTGLRGY